MHMANWARALWLSSRQYSWQETKSWLAPVGFTRIARVPLGLNHGAIMARKP